MSNKPRKAVKAEKNYWFALALLVPPILTFLFSICLMPVIDSLNVAIWHTALMIFGFCVMPLTMLLFREFSSGGYFFSKTIGILLVSLLVWTTTYIGIGRFNKVFIIITMALIAIASYLIPKTRKAFLDKISDPSVIRRMLTEEVIFAFVFVLLCFFKGMYPDIMDQEKTMEYGFLMSMLRSDRLPANDMWLAGQPINYYYYGQYIYALSTKLFGIAPAYAYTLSMCTSIALPFASAYVIGTMMIELARKNGMSAHKSAKYVCGVLAGLVTIIFGNSHSFFYDPDSAGHPILEFLRSKGVTVGQIDSFFYPESTRFIGHNPELKVIDPDTGAVIFEGDYTIHEFPFYSYLVGDLHAHVISMMIVLLIIAVCIALLMNVKGPGASEMTVGSSFGNLLKKESFINFKQPTIKNFMHEVKMALTPEVFIIGILLGVAQMTNYWDFLIYFIFSAMTFLVFNTVRSKLFIYPSTACAFCLDLLLILLTYMTFSEKVYLHIVLQAVLIAIGLIFSWLYPSALTRTSLSMNIVFVISHIIALPFNANFDMISNKIAPVKTRSSIYQLIILWGVHVLICLIFIVFTIVNKNYVKSGKNSAQVFSMTGKEPTNIVAKFFCQRNLCDVFVCGMSITGFLMLIAPELIYVRDIYTGGYLRSNTMFKFTFAGFIMLSLCLAYIVVRLFWYVGKNGRYNFAAFCFAFFCALLLFIPGHYTILSLKQRSGDLTKSNFKTLDGTKYLESFKSNDTLPEDQYAGNLMDLKRAIDWFNENVEGDPVICEAYGDSYTNYNLVSSYTGLPTIIGWTTHEHLWRFHGIVNEEKDLLESDPQRDVFKIFIYPRHDDIFTIYTSDDAELVKDKIDRYHVEYIVLGPFEYNSFRNDNSNVFLEFSDVVFSSGNVKVFKVR